MTELDDPEFQVSLRGYQRRWRIINGLLAVCVVVGLYFAWAKLLRVPSPSTICAHLWELATSSGGTDDDARQRRGVLRRVGGGLADMADGDARLAESCLAYIGAVHRELDWRAEGAFGRCMLASESAEAVSACWKDVPTRESEEALDQSLAANTEFPTRRPYMPEVIATRYDELLAITERALAGCEDLFDPDVGCYTYEWDGAIESLRERGSPIPSDPGALGSELLALEARCYYDAATWVRRNPQLRESARSFPLPLQRFGCNYLAQGQPHALGDCSTRTPYGEDAQVGVDDNLASVSRPYDPQCEGQWMDIRIERAKGDGVFVVVTALFRGPAWDPAVSTRFEIPEELRVQDKDDDEDE